MSRPSMPAVQPLPPDPMIEIEAQRKRAEAAATAVAESKAAGRRSTIVGGAKMAFEEQASRGSAAREKRTAARAGMGL